MIDNPNLGYEPHFLEQLAWNNGDAARLVAEKKIKIVHDGGALNPRGLAEKVESYLRSIDIVTLKVAWVSGDNLTQQVRNGKASYKHLDINGLEQRGDDARILAANAYTGCSGIISALEGGADIVICGRCTDASPVMGLASWWHGWKYNEYHKLAGALLAGHLIECGAYTTGGNYCGFQEIAKPYRMGYPIAEISEDGSCVITKPKGTNGAVTVDIIKGQIMYEIQGPYYLNPDVIAKIDKAHLEEVGPNRIRLTGIVGLVPPPTTKLAICLRGGYQAELSAFVVGLDIPAKVELMRSQVLRELNVSEYTVISIQPYGSAKPNPRTQAESTVQIRMFVQANTTQAIERFKKAIFYNGMQGYCGLHLSMDWRTIEPKLFVKYFPALVSQDNVKLSVNIVGDMKTIAVRPTPPNAYGVWNGQESYETADAVDLNSFGPVIQRPLGECSLFFDELLTDMATLGDLVFGRSGDKGGNANVGLWVRDPRAWPWLRSYLTIPRIIGLLADDWKPHYRVERFELENLYAVHFVVFGILQEGVSSSSIIDGFAKSFGEFIRARVVDLPVVFLDAEQKKRIQNISAAQGITSSL